jgi:predicted secreted hydrolase
LLRLSWKGPMLPLLGVGENMNLRADRRAAVALLAVALAALLVAGTIRLARPRRGDDLEARLSVAGSLRDAGNEGEGFARALAPRAFSFPADHGPHPEFRTEWWYWTGNLSTAEGRRFGFQLTFFRNAVAPQPPARASAWAARDVYLAHFTLTDVAGRRFHSCERVRRGALGLAGARALPFRVWLDDWQAAGPAAGDEATPMRLTAAAGPDDPAHAASPASPASPANIAGEIAIDLSLDRGKPPVLQGDRGLSRKGAGPGQASYYYSLTRMPARGRVRTREGDFAVSGLAWMDREWSTSSLGPGQVGWDWFSLQLDGPERSPGGQGDRADRGDRVGRELMFYRLRLAGGGSDPVSRGVLVEPDGRTRPLALADVRIETLARWTSPASGARYPSRWRLRVPAAGLDLAVRPLLAGQELNTSFRYWEGAVEVSGRAGGRPATGHGYVELTGYAERPGAGETR